MGKLPGSHLGVTASPVVATFTLGDSQKGNLRLVAPELPRHSQRVQKACRRQAGRVWDRALTAGGATGRGGCR